MSGTSNPPANQRPPARKTRHPVERGLVFAIPAAVALIFLLWTGAVPGLYPASPIRWSEDAPACLHTGEALPSVIYRFPLWATVSIRWTAAADISFWAWGYDAMGSPVAGVNQIGTSGNASFVSNGDTMIFATSSLAINNCEPVPMSMVVAYAV